MQSEALLKLLCDCMDSLTHLDLAVAVLWDTQNLLLSSLYSSTRLVNTAVITIFNTMASQAAIGQPITGYQSFLKQCWTTKDLSTVPQIWSKCRQTNSWSALIALLVYNGEAAWVEQMMLQMTPAMLVDPSPVDYEAQMLLLATYIGKACVYIQDTGLANRSTFVCFTSPIANSPPGCFSEAHCGLPRRKNQSGPRVPLQTFFHPQVFRKQNAQRFGSVSPIAFARLIVGCLSLQPNLRQQQQGSVAPPRYYPAALQSGYARRISTQESTNSISLLAIGSRVDGDGHQSC